MDDRALLPIAQERVLELARRSLELGGRSVDTPLMVGSCHAKRAADGSILGFVVTVLVEPHLGVRVAEPTAEPQWGASTIIVMHLDGSGRPERPASN